ncbi:MAG: hypothetical protein ACP5KY_10185 [Thermoproteus sp.]
MGIAFAEVEIGGRKYRALIDTGFNGEVAVSRRSPRRPGSSRLGSRRGSSPTGRP